MGPARQREGTGLLTGALLATVGSVGKNVEQICIKTAGATARATSPPSKTLRPWILHRLQSKDGALYGKSTARSREAARLFGVPLGNARNGHHVSHVLHNPWVNFQTGHWQMINVAPGKVAKGGECQAIGDGQFVPT